MGRKKLPVTAIDRKDALHKLANEGGVSKNLKTKQAKFIAHFHSLNKSKDEDTAAKLGGLATYQEFSKLGENKRTFNCARWVVECLRARGFGKPKDAESKADGSSQKLQLLDVGALGQNFKGESSWIHVTAIDLHSCHPFVKQMDFFDVEEERALDAVCLSLVVNFVGLPERRGEMLAKTTRLLKENGYLFLVLPLACVKNSRYFNEEILLEMLKALGYTIVKTHCSPKLHFVMAQLSSAPSDYDGKFPKKRVLGGKERNNFFIVL